MKDQPTELKSVQVRIGSFAAPRAMREISSRRDLYEYLVELRSHLLQRNAYSLAAGLNAAIAAANMHTTELLGESVQALDRISELAVEVLSMEERSEVNEVSKYVKEALRKPRQE